MQGNETSNDDAKKYEGNSEEVRTPSQENVAKDVVTQAEEVVAAVIENEDCDSNCQSGEGQSEDEVSSDVAQDSSKGNPTQGVDTSKNEDNSTVLEDSSIADEQAEKFRLQAVAWQDKFIKLQTDWDLYRKRNAENAKQEKLQAAARIIEELIPVLDDFDRTIAYATQNGTEGLLDGVCAVQNKLTGVCIKEGVEVIDPKGEAFNALEAQAVSVVQDQSVYDETVLEVFQKGYKIGIKVIRPAMVVISSGGKKRDDETDSNSESNTKQEA